MTDHNHFITISCWQPFSCITASSARHVQCISRPCFPLINGRVSNFAYSLLQCLGSTVLSLGPSVHARLLKIVVLYYSIESVFLFLIMQTMSGHNNITPDIRSELSISEIYMYELKTNNAISLCDNTLKKFILQDFCFQSKSLKVS